MSDFSTGNSRFGEVIDQALRVKKLSQTQLAHDADISQSTVSKLVSGKRTLTEDTAQQISEVLGGTAEAWLRAQEDIVNGSELSVDDHVIRITGLSMLKPSGVEDLGTRVTQLRAADFLRIFDPQNDGYFTRRNTQEECQIDPFDVGRVDKTTYDTRVGGFGIPMRDGTKIRWKLDAVEGPLIIKPGQCCYVGTLEHFTVPTWLEGVIHPASNIGHKNLFVAHGPVIDPGFKGRLFVTVFNPTGEPIEISESEAFLSVRFWLAEDQVTRG